MSAPCFAIFPVSFCSVSQCESGRCRCCIVVYVEPCAVMYAVLYAWQAVPLWLTLITLPLSFFSSHSSTLMLLVALECFNAC